jgi:hypothetical protein
VAGALKLAETVLADAASIYLKMAQDNQHRFLRVQSPEGWRVERSGIIGNPANSIVYQYVGAVAQEHKQVGAPGGI